MFVVENCIEHRRKVYKKLSKGEICVANYISLVNVASPDSFFVGQLQNNFLSPVISNIVLIGFKIIYYFST